MDINVTYKVLSTPLSWLKNTFYKIKNIVLRPKIILEFKSLDITFKKDSEEKHFPYFCLIIKNQSDKSLSVNLQKIMINNESYQVIIQCDVNYLKLNPKNTDNWDDTSAKILNVYSTNWREISQNNFSYIIDRLSSHTLPLRVFKGMSHIYTSNKKKSLLFLPNRKISISLELDGRFFEFGYDRDKLQRKLINYLAFTPSRWNGAID